MPSYSGAAAPSHLASQLVGVEATRDSLPVISVSRDDVIIVGQGADGAHSNGLLANVEMQETANVAARV